MHPQYITLYYDYTLNNVGRSPCNGFTRVSGLDPNIRCSTYRRACSSNVNCLGILFSMNSFTPDSMASPFFKHSSILCTQRVILCGSKFWYSSHCESRYYTPPMLVLPCPFCTRHARTPITSPSATYPTSGGHPPSSTNLYIR